MAASDKTLLNNARDSLNRILQTDFSQYSEEKAESVHLEIDRLWKLIETLEARIGIGSKTARPITTGRL